MRQSHDLPLSLLPYAVFCALLGGFGMALFQPVPVTETSDRGSCEHQPEVPLLDRPILHAPPGHQVSSNGCTLTVAVSAPGADLMLQRVAPEKDLPVVKQLGAELSYVFEDLAPGRYQLTAGGARLPLSGAEPFVCTQSERGSRTVMFANAAHHFTGKLIGYRGRAPQGGELRFEQRIGDKNTSAGPILAPLQSDGTFDVLLPEGSYVGLATAPHHRTRRLEFDVSDRTAAVFRLTHEPQVRGRVVDRHGAPVAGAEVFLSTGLDPRLMPTTTVADGEGRFSIMAHSQGRVRLAARHDRLFGRTTLNRIKTIEGVSDVKIVVRQGRQVSGIVQTRTGRLKPHARVRYRVKRHGLTGTVTADGEGRFLLKGLPREDVEIWADGSATGAWGAVIAVPGQSRVLLTWVAPAYQRHD